MRLVEMVEMGGAGRERRMRECGGRGMVTGCRDRKKRIS